MLRVHLFQFLHDSSPWALAALNHSAFFHEETENVLLLLLRLEMVKYSCYNIYYSCKT